MSRALSGLRASSGVATGVLSRSADDALARVAKGERVVLVLHDVEREDTPALQKAVGVVTTTGGLTSDAAIVARSLGIPCVTSCAGLDLNAQGVVLTSDGTTLNEGVTVTVDGTAGTVTFEG